MYIDYNEYENMSTYEGGVCLVLKTISSIEADPGDVTLYDAVKSSCPGVEYGDEWYTPAELVYEPACGDNDIYIIDKYSGAVLYELIRA